MKFDFAKAAEYTETVVKSAASVRSGMEQLLDYCAANVPNPVWIRIRQLDFESDTVNLRSWLENVLSQDPPSKEINVFWFGLYNPVLDNEQTSCGLYLSGSTRFDPEDETGDWATWDDDSYLPEDRYADSSVLHKIYELVTESGVTDVGEYILCLGYAGLAVKVIYGAVSPKLLSGDRASRAIVVGFDSGDFIILDGAEQ